MATVGRCQGFFLPRNKSFTEIRECKCQSAGKDTIKVHPTKACDFQLGLTYYISRNLILTHKKTMK